MCSGLFGGGNRTPPPPPVPAAPTPPPPPAPVQQEATPLPETPTPTPVTTDETKRKAKVVGKQTAKKRQTKGTEGLATKASGTGLQGTGTPQGVNTGLGTIAGVSGTGSYGKQGKKVS